MSNHNYRLGAQRPTMCAMIESLEQRCMFNTVILPTFGQETLAQDGGARVVNPTIVLIFWGSYWNATDSAPVAADAKLVCDSGYFSETAQYGAGGAPTLDATTAFVNSDPPEDGFPDTKPQSIDGVVANAISSGQVPDLGSSAIYEVITPPGISSGTGGGYNQKSGHYETWISDDGDSSFEVAFSHETAECMTCPGGSGIAFKAGANVPPALITAAGGFDLGQIGDFEGNYYRVSEPDGAIVQPLWSAQDQAWVAVDGNDYNTYKTASWNGSTVDSYSVVGYSVDLDKSSVVKSVTAGDGSTYILHSDGALVRESLNTWGYSFKVVDNANVTALVPSGDDGDVYCIDHGIAGSPQDGRLVWWVNGVADFNTSNGSRDTNNVTTVVAAGDGSVYSLDIGSGYGRMIRWTANGQPNVVDIANVTALVPSGDDGDVYCIDHGIVGSPQVGRLVWWVNGVADFNTSNGSRDTNNVTTLVAASDGSVFSLDNGLGYGQMIRWTTGGQPELLDSKNVTSLTEAADGSVYCTDHPIAGSPQVARSVRWTNGVGDPVAVNDAVTTAINTPVLITELANDSDPNAGGSLNPKTVKIITPPAKGTAAVDPVTGNITYTPGVGYMGTYTFTYTVSDNFGLTSSPATVSVNIPFATHKPPVAVNASATTPVNTAVVISVLTNDSDPNTGGSLVPSSLVIGTQPAHGKVTINTSTGQITYTPTTGYTGADSFTYSVKDNFGLTSNIATVALTVGTAAKKPPVAVNDTAKTTAGTALVISPLSNDSDPNTGGSLVPSSLVIGTQPAHGKLAINASTGQVTYTPTAGYTGSDSFTYSVKDSFGLSSNIATVAITVSASTGLKPPVAVNTTGRTPANTPDALAELYYDSDPNPGGKIDISTVKIVSQPVHGTVSVSTVTGRITYIPATNFKGTDTFSYTVKDNFGLTSNVATITMTVL